MTKNTYSVRSHAVSTVKQVGGQDTPRLAPQELAPRRAGPPWGRAEAMATQQRSDGRRRDSHPELGEFSLDPQASPPRVVTSYSQDQVANVGCDRRSTAGRSVAVGPFPAHQLAVPTKERLRPDQERGPSLSRERSAQRSQVQPVPAAEAGPADLAPEDCELMAKDEDLDIVAPSIRRASHKGDQPAQEQVDEGEKHGSSLLSERPDPTKALLTGSIRVSVPLRMTDRAGSDRSQRMRGGSSVVSASVW
jgi:hypothetical protein